MAGKKLLVADDSLTIQKVIRLALSSAPGEGYEIQAVSEGNDAVQQISLFRPDLVLIDVSLPGKNAFEVKRAINEHPDLEEVRFILMSSAFEKYDEAQAEEVRFHGKLSKPFDPAHLRQVLTDALAQVSAKRSEKTTMISRPAQQESSTKDSGASKIALTPPAPTEHLPVSLPTGDEDEETDSGIDVLPDFEALSLEPKLEPELEPTLDSEPGADFLEPRQESDIRHLTESTIRMSGLDDFQWSVDDSSKKAAAPSQVREIGDRTLNQLTRQTPAIPPLDGFRDLSGANFQIDPPAPDPLSGMPTFHPENAESVESAASDFAVSPPPYRNPVMQQEASVREERAQVMPSFSSEQLEEMLKKQIEESFQKMAQQILPDIAERIIKQEISRMLKEGV